MRTPSDKDGNSVFKHICFKSKPSPTSWWLDINGDRLLAEATYVAPEWYLCGKKKWPVSDHPDAAIPGELFSQKAIDALFDLLDLKRGDLFSLGNTPEGSYTLYVLWERIAVVDLPTSDVVCGQMPVPVKMKIGYAIPHIFKSYHENRVWVTEVFKTAVESAGLTGFKFDFLGET